MSRCQNFTADSQSAEIEKQAKRVCFLAGVTIFESDCRIFARICDDARLVSRVELRR